MNLKIERSKLVKPFMHDHHPNPSLAPCNNVPLSVFDKVTYDVHIAVIFVYRPPTPTNATIELGFRRALDVYREWAGRFGEDDEGKPIILLNDEGARFVEASVDGALEETVFFRPIPDCLRSLHPNLVGVEELVQVQVTRFSCGSMVVGFTSHHFVADANATSKFLLAWSQACRGLEIHPLPLRDRAMFSPRCPPKFDFEHIGVEYVNKNYEKPKYLKKASPLTENEVDDRVMCKVHYSAEFISKLKLSAANNNKPYSTFESLVAHLWRAITKARGLNGLETTKVKVAVDGRARLNPKVPNEYFGNLVLWAFARATVEDLLSNPLPYAAKLLHEAVVNVNDDYFKSFIDFASHEARREDLVPDAVAYSQEAIFWPDMEVDSWLRFPFYDLDLGSGSPYIFMPSIPPTAEGLLFLLPSFAGDGSIDVFVQLFEENLRVFKHICYSLDIEG